MNRMRALAVAVLLFVSSHAFADYLVVTNVNDSGPGSLRQALLDLSTPGGCPRPCTIYFNIAGSVPASGYWTISPLSPLPRIGPPFQVTIDGRTQAGLVGTDPNPLGPDVVLSGASAGMGAGLLVMGTIANSPYDFVTIRGLGFQDWQDAGVRVSGYPGLSFHLVPVRNVSITESYFGIDAHGQTAAPNAIGIRMDAVWDAVIENNVISGNGEGIALGSGVRVRIANNNIGLDGSGTGTLGNGGVGVRLRSTTASVVERNVIAGHGTAVAVEGATSHGNFIHRNRMFDNGFGIDLGSDGPTVNDTSDADFGPHGLQNHPVLRSRGRLLSGELESTPSTDFDVEIFETDSLTSNQGRRYLGTVVVSTDASGRASFSFAIPSGSGPYYTATATNAEQSTSEFCNPVR